MARITKAQILEATKVEVRMNHEVFHPKLRIGSRCRKKSRINNCRCTREKYHPGPHVSVWHWADEPVDIRRVWFSADQKMKDMYEHYSNP